MLTLQLPSQIPLIVVFTDTQTHVLSLALALTAPTIINVKVGENLSSPNLGHLLKFSLPTNTTSLPG